MSRRPPALPKRLLQPGSKLFEPLLPTFEPPLSISGAGAEEDMSSKINGTSTDDDLRPALETHSFTSEAFHRFGNAAAAAQQGRVVTASSDSEARFTEGVDAKCDPELAAFANKERNRPAGSGGELGAYDYRNFGHVSIHTSAGINSGKE